MHLFQISIIPSIPTITRHLLNHPSTSLAESIFTCILETINHQSLDLFKYHYYSLSKLSVHLSIYYLIESFLCYTMYSSCGVLVSSIDSFRKRLQEKYSIVIIENDICIKYEQKARWTQIEWQTSS